MILGICIAVAVIIADQLSKLWVMDYLMRTQPVVEVTPFFNLTYAWNTGISFSMFSNSGTTGAIILSVVALAIVASLLWWLKTEQVKAIRIALGMIIGGAIGNIIDRVRLGAVFDFLDIYVGSYHWPVFNLADSFICIGAVIIVTHSLLNREQKNNKEQNK